MGWYSRKVLPKLIEAGCSQKLLMRLRAQYVPQAQGKVLEIGIGTGLNLEFYDKDRVQLTGLDPAAELTGHAQERAQALDLPVEMLGVSTARGLDAGIHRAFFRFPWLWLPLVAGG